MSKIAAFLTVVVAAAVVALGATPAGAAAPTKVWVSNAGVDSGTCGAVTAPCRSFFQASQNVAAGGDVGVLTPGDYGQPNIIKSMNITNDGVGEATIFASNGPNDSFFPGMIIVAGRGDVVSLRGLIVDGQGGGGFGVGINQVSAVHIQNCVIRNFEGPGNTGYGIAADPPTSTQLFVSDTLIYNNGTGPGTGGVVIAPQSSGSANVVLDRVHVENNVVGISLDGSNSTGDGIHLVIRGSVVAGNASNGIVAFSQPGKPPAFILVEHSSSVNNAGTGILADGPRAVILLKDNTITRNGTGIGAVNGGQLISYGNNTNNNNIGPEGAPTSLFSPM